MWESYLNDPLLTEDRISGFSGAGPGVALFESLGLGNEVLTTEGLGCISAPSGFTHFPQHEA